MASFYLDNDVRLALAALLDAAGHTVITTRQRLQTRAPDDEQLLYAAQNRLTLITCNVKHFRNLHYAWCHWLAAAGVPWKHAGILMLEQATAEDMADAVLGLLRQQPALANALFEWHKSTGWYRHPEG